MLMRMQSILGRKMGARETMLLGFTVCCFLSLRFGYSAACGAQQFRPGEVWLDTTGQPIHAHGGGILVHSNVYYWYGEDRSMWKTSVSCYSSTNLHDWNHEGVAFTPEAFPEEFKGRSFIERPKVIYNPVTGKYVMWFHMEQRGYHFARAGIAVGDKPSGPFVFRNAVRPIRDDFDFKEGDVDRQKEQGGTFRDMNLFVDDDGKAYVFYASEGNWTMYVVRLNAEFTGPETPTVLSKTWNRVLVRQMREAPAPFKFRNKYYLVTSGCTGWKPNKAEYAVADHVLGPWETKGNPCVGEDAETTFGAQSTFVFPVAGKSGAFVFMSDRWNPGLLRDSRYVWLPLDVAADGLVKIPWRGAWGLSASEAQ
jgi:hypothetical protein